MILVALHWFFFELSFKRKKEERKKDWLFAVLCSMVVDFNPIFPARSLSLFFRSNLQWNMKKNETSRLKMKSTDECLLCIQESGKNRIQSSDLNGKNVFITYLCKYKNL